MKQIFKYLHFIIHNKTTLFFYKFTHFYLFAHIHISYFILLISFMIISFSIAPSLVLVLTLLVPGGGRSAPPTEKIAKCSKYR